MSLLWIDDEGEGGRIEANQLGWLIIQQPMTERLAAWYKSDALETLDRLILINFNGVRLDGDLVAALRLPIE